MNRAAIMGAIFVLTITLVAYGSIAHGSWNRAGANDTPDLRQFLAQIIAEAPHPSTGKPAADFTTETLAGREFTLSEYRGQAVVILDFWATWCPPCRASMPILSKVAEEYRKKNPETPVYLFAVNLGESKESIRQFLQRTGIDVNVLMDQNRSISDEFGVDGIPHTVVIGKDGTIQAVHVGLSRDLESQLKMELDTLIQGRTLVTPKA